MPSCNHAGIASGPLARSGCPHCLLGINDLQYTEWHDSEQVGYSVVRDPGSSDLPGVDIATLDFPRLLTLLRDRAPPPGGRLGRTVIKMDIETGEFAVLPAMAVRGTLCHEVDHLAVEFHERHAPIHFAGRGLELPTADAATVFKTQLSQMVRDSAAACVRNPRGFEEKDDEAYVSDVSPEQKEDPMPMS